MLGKKTNLKTWWRGYLHVQNYRMITPPALTPGMSQRKQISYVQRTSIYIAVCKIINHPITGSNNIWQVTHRLVGLSKKNPELNAGNASNTVLRLAIVRQTPGPSCPYPSGRPPSGHRPGYGVYINAHTLQVALGMVQPFGMVQHSAWSSPSAWSNNWAWSSPSPWPNPSDPNKTESDGRDPL